MIIGIKKLTPDEDVCVYFSPVFTFEIDEDKETNEVEIEGFGTFYTDETGDELAHSLIDYLEEKYRETVIDPTCAQDLNEEQTSIRTWFLKNTYSLDAEKDEEDEPSELALRTLELASNCKDYLIKLDIEEMLELGIPVNDCFKILTDFSDFAFVLRRILEATEKK